MACHNRLLGELGLMGCLRIDCSLKGSNKTVQRGIFRYRNREKVTSNTSGVLRDMGVDDAPREII